MDTNFEPEKVFISANFRAIITHFLLYTITIFDSGPLIWIIKEVISAIKSKILVFSKLGVSYGTVWHCGYFVMEVLEK